MRTCLGLTFQTPKATSNDNAIFLLFWLHGKYKSFMRDNVSQKKGFFCRIESMDRRWIFLAITLATALPFVTTFSIRANPGEETLRFDDALVRAIDKGMPVIVGVDFGPQTMSEMEPLLLSVMHRLFESKTPTIFLTFMTESAAPVREYLASMEKRYDLKYGVDYVFLGYASSFAFTIYGMGTSIGSYFHADDRGTALSELPIMKGVENYKDVSAVINIASNAMPKFWISYGVAPYNFDLLVGCTAVQATDYYPFLQTGQVDGLLAGGRAGAEYEGLLVDKGVISETGDATRGLGSQSMALIAVLAFIVLGNISYFAARVEKKRGRG